MKNKAELPKDKPQLVFPFAFTAMPNELIDQVMPTLKDTQWRLLCVICRQTVGWQSQSGSGRKARDWMSQKQLMARTGRNSAALSAALNELVRKNLVECSDGRGQLLTTVQQRRTHRGRLYFALSPRLIDRPNGDGGTILDQEEPAGIEKATRAVSLARQPVRIYRGWSRVGVVAKSRIEQQ